MALDRFDSIEPIMGVWERARRMVTSKPSPTEEARAKNPAPRYAGETDEPRLLTIDENVPIDEDELGSDEDEWEREWR